MVGGFALQWSATAARSGGTHSSLTSRLARCALGQSLPHPWRREVKEGSQLEWQEPLTGEDETARPRRWLEFRKRDSKRARPNRGRDLPLVTDRQHRRSRDWTRVIPRPAIAASLSYHLDVQDAQGKKLQSR